jgi:hypothetical protein
MGGLASSGAIQSLASTPQHFAKNPMINTGCTFLVASVYG